MLDHPEHRAHAEAALNRFRRRPHGVQSWKKSSSRKASSGVLPSGPPPYQSAVVGNPLMPHTIGSVREGLSVYPAGAAIGVPSIQSRTVATVLPLTCR